jgi:hypothetical protein
MASTRSNSHSDIAAQTGRDVKSSVLMQVLASPRTFYSVLISASDVVSDRCQSLCLAPLGFVSIRSLVQQAEIKRDLKFLVPTRGFFGGSSVTNQKSIQPGKANCGW